MNIFYFMKNNKSNNYNNSNNNLSMIIFIICFMLIVYFLFTNTNTIYILNQDNILIQNEVKFNYSIFEVIFLMILSSIGFYNLINNYKFQKNVIKKKKKEKQILNLLEKDELKIYKFLLEKNNEIYQKDLIYELGLNKVKITRVLNNLVKKNLIEKISYSNTNKIKIK